MVETSWIVLLVCGLAVFAVGLVSGIGVLYFLSERQLKQRYYRLVKQLINLKKQGFVPQFEVEQEHEPDLSDDITEY